MAKYIKKIKLPTSTESYLVCDETVRSDLSLFKTETSNNFNLKQSITDSTLTTTAKTIPTAINELVSKNTSQDTRIEEVNDAIPTKVSQLTNDSAYITKSVSELTNFYTKTSIDDLLSTLKKNSYQVVTTKPTTGEEGYVYLVGSSAPYEMWIYEASSSATDKWIDLGSTSVDLTGYVKGSSLTDNKVILGNAGSNIKASSVSVTITLGSDDTTLPTSKAIQTALDTKQDTLTAGNGIEISGNTISSNIVATSTTIDY